MATEIKETPEKKIKNYFNPENLRLSASRNFSLPLFREEEKRLFFRQYWYCQTPLGHQNDARM